MTSFRILTEGPRCPEHARHNLACPICARARADQRYRIVTDLLENPVSRKDALAMGLNCDPQDLSPEEAPGVLRKLNEWMERQKKGRR